MSSKPKRPVWWRLARGLVVFGAVLALWAFALEPASLRVRETTLTLEKWPSEFDGLRVAVLADLHTGSPWNGRRNLERVVRETNEAEPDLVLIAG
ncbi:MAG: metallophosphoesterase, partial [Bacteroidota bacterium]